MTEILKLNKKILIISSYAPPKITGGALYLYNIFSNISPDSYCFLTSKKNFILSSNKITGQKYVLGCRYFFYDELNFSNKNKVINTLLIPLKILRITKRALRVIKSEKIEIIVGISDNGRSYLTAFLLSKLSGKPYCLYAFDLYKENSLTAFWKKIAVTCEPYLFKSAKLIFLSGQGPKNYYKQIYPKLRNFVVINGSGINYGFQQLPNDHKPNMPYNLIFAGNIYWAQEKSLGNIIQAVSEINDLDLCIKIYTPKITPKIFNKYGEREKIELIFAPPEDMPEIERRADILLLPLSWGTPSPEIINTATPAKLVSYLQSGRPILIHAPAESYLSQNAKLLGFACVVDTEDIEKIKISIRKLLLDIEYSKKLIETAHGVFLKNYDAQINSDIFATIINGLPSN